MKSLNVTFATLAIIFTALSQAHATCTPVETVDPEKYMWVVAEKITLPGEYCLTHDLHSRRPFVFSEGGERTHDGGGMLIIDASNVVFDLHGYTLNADARGMSGIESGFWKNISMPQKISIRNGTLKSRSASAIEFGIPNGSIYSDFRAMHHQSPSLAAFYKSQFGISDIAEDELQKLLKTLPQSAEAYTKTEYLIDRVKIESGSVPDYVGIYRKAIGMNGASNIIRNSTIEITDGHAAIYLFGPNQLIENNIIIFKGKAAVESAAAIKLHQADGSIIRNNDIIIESSGDDSPKAAISLIDSKNVLIENNRIYGIKKLTHAWDDKSSSIENNNEFRSMLRRPWTTGAPGVH